jgi:hypothetical protein
MKRFLLIAALATVGCSGESGTPECDRTDRSGTYLFEYSQRDGGTCGDLPDYVGRLDVDAPIPAECTLTADDDWSPDLCKLTRSMSCLDTDGVTVNGTAITEQQDSEGDVLSGLYTVELRDSGGTLCMSTYNLTATRQ